VYENKQENFKELVVYADELVDKGITNPDLEKLLFKISQNINPYGRKIKTFGKYQWIEDDGYIWYQIEKYEKDTMPKLSVGKVISAFTMDKSQYWRTRGQFVVKDNYHNQKFNKVKLYENFLKHDYSELHRSKIIRDFYKWVIRENYPETIKTQRTEDRLGDRIFTKDRIGERVPSKIRKLGRFPTKDRIGERIPTKVRVGEKVASKLRLQDKISTIKRLEKENNL